MGRKKTPPFLRPASGRNEGVYREDTLTMSVEPAETQRCEKASAGTSVGIAYTYAKRNSYLMGGGIIFGRA